MGMLGLLALLPLLSHGFRLPSLPSARRPQHGPATTTGRGAGVSSLQPRPPQSPSRLGLVAPLRLAPLPQEALMAPLPEKVLAAVERAGGRVTVQDVAALAGVDLSTAQKGLVRLASLVDGDLEVGKDGDLVYQFPRNFRTALRTRSFAQRAKEVRGVSCRVVNIVERLRGLKGSGTGPGRR